MTATIGDIVKIRTDSGDVIVSVVAIHAASGAKRRMVGRDITTCDEMFVFSDANIVSVILQPDQDRDIFTHLDTARTHC